MNQNIYIKISEFGERNLNGFNYKKIIDENLEMKDWEKSIIQESVKNAFYNKTHMGAPGFNSKESFFYCLDASGGEEGLSDRSRYILKSESYFNYIDYVELREARETAKKAHRTSIIAIVIATIAVVISTTFSIIEIFHRIKN